MAYYKNNSLNEHHSDIGVPFLQVGEVCSGYMAQFVDVLYDIKAMCLSQGIYQF